MPNQIRVKNIYFIDAEDVANLRTMMILGEVGRMEVGVARMVGVVEKMSGGAKKRWAEGRERSEKSDTMKIV